MRSYYRVGPVESSKERGAYGDYEDEHSGSGTTGSSSAATVGSGMSMGDTETGEFREHERADEDELRVQRSEEELVAGTREREAGAMRIRKRVRSEEEMRIRKDVVEDTEVVPSQGRRSLRIRRAIRYSLDPPHPRGSPWHLLAVQEIESAKVDTTAVG